MYNVSVITPFHNVDLGMFAKAAASMRNQTIGFINVEWIIILHNCEPQYAPQVTEMFKDDGNVVVKVLNNEARTPSSPRNYGLQFATAPIVGYLDGDDSYAPDCLEKAVQAMTETESQVVSFRREYELEDNSLLPVTELVGWNQTLERVVIEHDNWDVPNMFYSLGCGMVTSKLFDRQFLIDNHITFDEEVFFTEDALYCAQTIGQARRVCYLPQLIGYHYFINGGSLVQKERKSAETLVSYARGFAKIFSTFDDYGIESPAFFWGVLLAFSNYMIASADLLSLDDRQQIKAYLAPFINRARPLMPMKGVTEEYVEVAMHIPQSVIMNPEGGISDFVRSVQNGLPQLKSILKANKDTDYGKRYSFESINTIKGYQRRVPMTSYEDYKQLIRLQTQTGEEGILVGRRVERYIRKRSGKLLPVTEEHIRPYNNAFATQLKGHHSLLLCASRPLGQATNDMAFADSLESILMKDYLTKVYYASGVTLNGSGLQATKLTPSIAHLFSDREDFDAYSFMMEGIADRDIDQIVALTTGDILQAFKVMEARWPEMVAEIAQRDKSRAQELQSIIADGFEGIASRLWPRLKRTVAFGAGKQQEATDQLRHYTKGTPHNHGFYFTAESLLAQAVGNDSNQFRLITRNDVYEFLPIDGQTGELPLTLSETKPGESYQIVITNKAGLYRFKTKHTVTIVQHELSNGTIVTIK